MDRPTLANWMSPEYTRWSFRHVRELIPSARVRHGHHPRTLASSPSGGLLDLEVDLPTGRQTVRAFLDDNRTDALVVLRDGAAPVVEIIPEIADSGFAGTTVRNLLDMTASYRFTEDYSPGHDLTAYRNAAGWYPAPFETPGLRSFLATREPEGTHGEIFRYMSPTTDLLGWVCEVIAGEPYAIALSRYLWVPMGAEHDAEMTLDREGAPRAAGGLSVTPQDMARIGLLVAEGGAGLVPEDFVDDLLHGGDPGPWARGDFADYFPGGAYRSCWYQPRVDPDCVCAVGIHGQHIYVDRPRNVVVAIQSSWDDPDPEPLHVANYLISRAIARAISADEPALDVVGT
jgi:CubicO group peptidase (beta-lactamase class C family)